MSPSAVPVPSRSLAASLGDSLSRPVTGRHLLAGGLLLSLAAAAPLISHVGAVPFGPPVRPAGESRPAASLLPPADLARAVSDRASRGAGRTALPVTALRTVPVGRTFSGLASWYGGSFQGRRTANGERFDTGELTAASRTLPFGTRLRVCRGSRCVVVRINDRGPYVTGRVLDLSAAASGRLGISGVARVTATPVGVRRVPVRPATAVVTARLSTARLSTARRPLPRVDLRPAPHVRAASDRHGRGPLPHPAAPLGLALAGASGVGLTWARRRRS